MTELVVNLAMYGFPLAALPFAVRIDPSARRIAVLSLFVAPLLGAATYLVLKRRFSLAGVAGVLPFAVVPLGFWAALLAALATPALRRAHDLLRARPSAFVVTSAAGGAVIGAAFMWGFSVLVATIRPVAGQIDIPPHVLAGLSAGAFVATIAGRPFVGRFTP